MRASTILIAMTIAGCGAGVPMRGGPLDPGQVDTDPSMESLPDPDVADTAFTRRMRVGWELAAESFLVPPPDAPDNRTALNLEVWADEVLGPWLERKTHTIEAARRELDQAAEENHRQRIMGGAIVGLMYEDVARVLSNIPAPAELEDEPEIQEIYQAILRSNARPFLEHSRRAYNACARNAIQPESMRHWSRFCAGRQDRLPEGEGAEREGTSVEVIAD